MDQHVATESTNCIRVYTPRYGRQHQIATVWLFGLMVLYSRDTAIHSFSYCHSKVVGGEGEGANHQICHQHPGCICPTNINIQFAVGEIVSIAKSKY